jgi:CBS domain containing-hemolysin-like protein
MLEIIILLCLIFLNGLFVMAEIALVSARKSRLENMADKGDFDRTDRHHPDRHFGGILFRREIQCRPQTLY